jgi:hypothetical protein
MAGKWQVISWEKGSVAGARHNHDCFETRQDAERFILDASREHPDRVYEYEECKHPEHRNAANA